MPKVSILMTVCNQSVYVKQAIQSVLNQSFSDWELLIADDASSDDSVETIRSFVGNDARVSVLSNVTRLGVSANRNLALQNMVGEYVAVLDADDVWVDNNKLEKQVKYLDENMDCVLVSGNARYIDAKGAVLRETNFPVGDEIIRKVILSKNVIIHSAAMYRLKDANTVGGYADLRVGEDYDLWLRLGQIGKFCILPDFLVNYRLSDNQATKEKVLDILWTNIMIVRKYAGRYPKANLALWRRLFRYMAYWPISKFFVK